MEPEELVRVLEILDPKKEAGRVTLICRYGADKVRPSSLPHYLRLTPVASR